MKIAVTGKGGVGKTTLAAMLAGALALRGRDVIAVDADPDANLASALGVSPEESITPLAEMRELIEQRTGTTSTYGGYFKLNPKVDDIPEEYAREIDRIRLLVLGGVKAGGDGCICPASALLKALLVHLVLGRKDALIMDMEAGIEHLGRATARSMDALIVLVDRGPWSIQTAHRVNKLAGDLGMSKIFAVANRISRPEEIEAIKGQLGDIPLIGYFPEDNRFRETILELSLDGKVRPGEALKAHMESVEKILSELENRT